MADRCDHCSVRMDGLEVHSDDCPARGPEIVAENKELQSENRELQAEIKRLMRVNNEAFNQRDTVILKAEGMRKALEAYLQYDEDPDHYPMTVKAPWLLAEEALGISGKRNAPACTCDRLTLTCPIHGQKEVE